MSNAMSWFIIVGTGLSLVACFWLVVWTKSSEGVGRRDRRGRRARLG